MSAKEDRAKEFQERVLESIASGEYTKVTSLCFGCVKIVLMGIDTPIELKRFAHIFKQCDLNDLGDTLIKLSKADFIKDIKYKYASEISLKHNFKYFYGIYKLKFLLMIRRFK